MEMIIKIFYVLVSMALLLPIGVLPIIILHAIIDEETDETNRH